MALIILPLAILALLTGVSVVVFARWGRCIDDHPLCRKCGYDMTGRPASSTRCSECGSDLTQRRAVRIGHRVPRLRLFWLGVLTTVISLFVAALAIWVQQARVNLIQYEPVWLLRQAAASTNIATRSAAVTELIRRFDAAKLSGAQVQLLVSEALRIQADSSYPWSQWAVLACRLDVAGKITDADWISFVRQGLKMRLVTRPQIRPGDPMPITLRMDTSRLPSEPSQFILPAGPASSHDVHLMEFEWLEASLDGRPIAHLPSHNGQIPAPEISGSKIDLNNLDKMFEAFAIRFSPSETAGLKAGTHTFVARLKVRVFDQRRNTSIGEFDLKETMPVKFLPAKTAAADLFTHDASLQSAMERAITYVRIWLVQPGMIGIAYGTNKAPLAFSHRIYIRMPNGTLVPTINLGGSPGEQGNGYTSFPIDLGTAATVDLVIKPDQQSLLESSQPYPVWGGEIVIRNVPVIR